METINGSHMWCDLGNLPHGENLKDFNLLFLKLFKFCLYYTFIQSYVLSKLITNKDITILRLFCLFLQRCPVRHVADFPISHHIFVQNITIHSTRSLNISLKKGECIIRFLKGSREKTHLPSWEKLDTSHLILRLFWSSLWSPIITNL